MKIEEWRLAVKEANPDICEASLNFMVEREKWRRKANQWALRGLDGHHIPHVRRKRRMEMFVELGVSLAESLPEFFDLVRRAEDVYLAEHPGYVRRLP